MSNNASLTLEQSLAHTEADALETWDVAKDLLRPLRRLRSAAETGVFQQPAMSLLLLRQALGISSR